MRTTLVSVFLLDFKEFGVDQVITHLIACQQFIEVSNKFLEFLIFSLQFINTQACERAQTHIHDCFGLQFVDIETCLQISLSIGRSAACTDNTYHFIDIIYGDDQSFQDMSTIFRFFEFETRTTSNHFHAVLNEITDELLEIQEHWTAFHERNTVHSKAGLQRSELIQLVQHHLCVCVTLHFHNDADITFRMVADICDSFDLLIVDQFRNILYQISLNNTVRQFGNHDALTSVVIGLDIGIRTNNNTSATGFISIFNALITVNRTASREIRSFHMFHQILYGNFRNESIMHACLNIIDIRATTINNLRKVVCRHICCHTNGNTACTIYQQVRETARQNNRLFERVVEVILHINGILVDIAEHFLGQFAQTSLSITHSSCAIAIDRTEVTLTINQAITHCPRLSHTD